MNPIVTYLEEIIGSYEPITETGSHFYGIDPKWIIGGVVVVVILVGFFNLIRAVVRS